MTMNFKFKMALESMLKRRMQLISSSAWKKYACVNWKKQLDILRAVFINVPNSAVCQQLVKEQNSAYSFQVHSVQVLSYK